jgi:hypothetical protein
MIFASREGEIPPLTERPLQWPDMKRELALLGMSSLAQFEALRVADRDLLHGHLAGRKANSDARPILDNGAERARFFQESSESLLALRWLPLPIQEAFSEGRAPAPNYPREGIPREWTDKHVLYEPEKAVLMMEAYAFRDQRARPGTGEIRRLFDQQRAMSEGARDELAWQSWFEVTYDIYNQVAPWLPLSGTRWWLDTLAEANGPDVPPRIARGIALLDAAARRDGAALLEQVELQGVHDDQLFDRRLVALAGAVAMALEDAPQSERRAYVEQRMRGIGNGPSADDTAFRIVRDALEASPSSRDRP